MHKSTEYLNKLIHVIHPKAVLHHSGQTKLQPLRFGKYNPKVCCKTADRAFILYSLDISKYAVKSIRESS